MQTITGIPTFPMRPMNGGDFMRSRPKRGEWIYQPKLNGWRAILNTHTGEMFNRHGKPLSITHEFSESVKAIREHTKWQWLDCEGMARRHNIERGKLYVLDYIPESYDKTPFVDRHAALDDAFHTLECIVDYVPAHLAESEWQTLQNSNKVLGDEFFEGFVAKRLDSPYVHQLRSSSEESPYWIKHRWEF